MKTAAHRKPGKTESRLAFTLTVLLLVIGAGVFMRQCQMSPAVLALRPEAQVQPQPSGTDSPGLIDVTSAGIMPFSPPEHFTADTLYEKINGRADLYLSSGFVGLQTQRFSTDPASGKWVEMFVYDMATPENAFSVFSMQRREGAQPDDIAPNAYRTENALFLALNNAYLELIGTDASPELHTAMGVLAGTYIQTIGGNAAADAPGSELFPQEGLRSGSLQLITANAFGYEQLDQVYTCEYLQDDEPLTAFVSRRADDEAAVALAHSYQQTLLSYGAAAVNAAMPLEGAMALHFFDTYEVIFSRGPYIGGVHEADRLGTALLLAERLAGHLESLDK